MLPSGIGCSSTETIRKATSAKKAGMAQASSHHMRAVYHRYQSLNTVESIATPWKDAATAADRYRGSLSTKSNETAGEVTNQCAIPVREHHISDPRSSVFSFRPPFVHPCSGRVRCRCDSGHHIAAVPLAEQQGSHMIEDSLVGDDVTAPRYPSIV